MNREATIKKLIEFNLELARNSTEWNDQFIYDVLRHGFKGFENMTDEELLNESFNAEYPA